MSDALAIALQSMMAQVRQSAQPVVAQVHDINDFFVDVEILGTAFDTDTEGARFTTRVPNYGSESYRVGDKIWLLPYGNSWVVGGFVNSTDEGEPTLDPVLLRADQVKTSSGTLDLTDLADIGKVKVSSDDTTADYLFSKLAAGTGITLTEINGGGNEDARIALTVPVAATSGGTAQSAWDQGDILYASAANTLARLAKGSSGQFLKIGATIPAWASLAASDIASGTLGVTRGGTGIATVATGDILYATGANTLGRRAIGSDNQILATISGAPNWVDTLLRYHAQTADQTVGNTTSETTLIGSGTGFAAASVPANFARVGSTVRVRMRGYLSTAAAAGTLEIKAKLGGTEICASGAVTMTDSLTNVYFDLEVDITFRTIGATGTVVAGGRFSYNNGTAFGLLKTTTTTIDTTGTRAMGLTAAWGTADASNTITSQQFTFELGG